MSAPIPWLAPSSLKTAGSSAVVIIIVSAEVTPKSTEETTLKSTEESQAPAVVAEQQYKGITGIVLYDGTVIEGQILFMSADIVKIRTKDGNTSSYSFIKEVQSFIKE